MINKKPPPYHPPEYTIRLPDSTIESWKHYLQHQDRLKKEEQHQEMIKRLSTDPNYEKYRAHVLKDGRKDTDFGFESLFMLHKHLEETPKEELQKEFDRIDAMEMGGPTVDEYFESLNPAAQYQKGYSEDAKKFKDAVINKLRNEFSDENGRLSRDEVIGVLNLFEVMNDIYDNG